MPIQELVFGHFLQNRRKTLKLTRKELALKMGYRNISKGIRRIIDVENGIIIESIISKLMVALEIPEKDRIICNEKEQSYIQDYVNKLPEFKPKLLYRAMACVYIPMEIPPDLQSIEDVIIFASDYARERKAFCCLELDYNLRYYINKEGGISKADRKLCNVLGAKPNIGQIL